MKRVVFASILMAAIIIFNCFCLFVIKESKNRVMMRLDEISTAISEDSSPEKILKKSTAFTEFWTDEHHLLCRVVRHELLDQMTIGVSRFEPLAKYGDLCELSAEISRCRFLIEEIWDSERPLFRNIF